MDISEIRKMVDNLRRELGIEEKVSVRIKPMKRKKATVSLIKKEIRINGNLLKEISKEEILEILIHELLHLRHGIYHTKDFLREANSLREAVKYLTTHGRVK